MRCGESQVYHNLQDRKKVKSRRKRNKKGVFVTSNSVNEFNENHRHCNKKCLNCQEIFIDITSYNNHLGLCNLKALQHSENMPTSMPINSKKIVDSCKGNNK